MLGCCRRRSGLRRPVGAQVSLGKMLPMHRFFGFMALTAAGLGLYLLFGPDGVEPKGASAQALDNAPAAYGVWAVGLLMGLTLAWLAGVEWSTASHSVTTFIGSSGQNAASWCHNTG